MKGPFDGYYSVSLSTPFPTRSVAWRHKERQSTDHISTGVPNSTCERMLKINTSANIAWRFIGFIWFNLHDKVYWIPEKVEACSWKFAYFLGIWRLVFGLRTFVLGIVCYGDSWKSGKKADQADIWGKKSSSIAGQSGSQSHLASYIDVPRGSSRVPGQYVDVRVSV